MRPSCPQYFLHFCSISAHSLFPSLACSLSQPAQVRFLNPIDSTHTDHRLRVTTRIRDLVPKATRVELPLMAKDEAVALLLDLANVEEAEYLKEQPGSAWPPEAAYAIVSECGLLPITLPLAAQVVRSWGEGWGE